MRRLLSTSLCLVLLGVLAPSPASAAESADGCTAGTEPRADLQSVTLTYSASSVYVAVTPCGAGPGPNGDLAFAVHVEGLATPLQLIVALQDGGAGYASSGFHACTTDSCRVTNDPQTGSLQSPGAPLDGSCVRGWCTAVTLTGYGAWADLLPAGTPVPPSLDWNAEVLRRDRDTWIAGDRVPDSGAATSQVNTSTAATKVMVTAAPAAAWGFSGAWRTDAGTLTTAGGEAIRDRLVRVAPVQIMTGRIPTDADGAWRSSYVLWRNTTVRAHFVGDGSHDPAVSDPYTALVAAFVSLNLPVRSSVALHAQVVLKGVVRPQSSGTVQVLVRADRPGAAYHLLRYTSLVKGSYDTVYRTDWRPLVRGRYVLRSRWVGGTTAPGGIANGLSTYHYVTVA